MLQWTGWYSLTAAADRYQPGRGQEGPKKLLKDFTGVLQTDAYPVYQSLFKNSEKVTQLYCMAHIRRKFDEAVSYDQTRATYAVEQIARLYKIEKDIRAATVETATVETATVETATVVEALPTLTENQIVEIRREHASPILDEIKQWMIEEYPKVTPSSPIGKAFSYALPLWDNMFYYTLHGHLQIDNNAIENAIRPIALGRKNYMFAGTHQAAQNAAMVYSLFATVRRSPVKSMISILSTGSWMCCENSMTLISKVNSQICCPTAGKKVTPELQHGVERLLTLPHPIPGR
jgi:transposase